MAGVCRGAGDLQCAEIYRRGGDRDHIGGTEDALYPGYRDRDRLRKICRVFLKRDIPDTTDTPIKKRAVSVSIFAGGSAHSSDIGSGRNLRPALEL